MKLTSSLLVKTVCIYGAAVFPLVTLAQTDTLQLELSRCSAITDINARVACYDNLARPQQNKAAASASQAPAAKVVESAPSPVKTVEPAATAKAAAPAHADAQADKIETFGQQQTKVVSNANGEDVLIGKVSMLKELGSNKLEITLANGQVWKQAIGKPFLLRENDTVRISPSSWGDSYRLEKDGKPGFIQVSRTH